MKSNAQPEILTFREEDVHRTQARLKGRTVLVPEIDLNAYRFRAVIDWVKLRFVVGRNTQFPYLQDAIEKELGRRCYVEPIKPGPGGVSDTFDVVFQEPASIQALREICDKVEDAYGLKSRPEVVGIEVSVDAYPSMPSDSARAQILGVMQRTIFTDRDIWSAKNDRQRFVFGSNDNAQDEGNADEFRNDENSASESDAAKKKTTRYVAPDPDPEKAKGKSAFNPEHFEAMPVDATVYLGPKGGPVMIRVMDKIMDQQNRKAGTREDLAEDRKRARIEVMLRGAELKRLGIGTVDDLCGLNFRKLQKKYFQFMLPTFEKASSGKMTGKDALLAERAAWRKKVFTRSGVVGVMAMDNERERFRMMQLPDLKTLLRRLGRPFRTKRTGTGTTQQMMAYEALNEKVAVALRSLGEREARAMKVVEAEDV
jgi:hypothetical protein